MEVEAERAMGQRHEPQGRLVIRAAKAISSA